jgi:hypothetical protein
MHFISCVLFLKIVKCLKSRLYGIASSGKLAVGWQLVHFIFESRDSQCEHIEQRSANIARRSALSRRFGIPNDLSANADSKQRQKVELPESAASSCRKVRKKSKSRLLEVANRVPRPHAACGNINCFKHPRSVSGAHTSENPFPPFSLCEMGVQWPPNLYQLSLEYRCLLTLPTHGTASHSATSHTRRSLHPCERRGGSTAASPLLYLEFRRLLTFPLPLRYEIAISDHFPSGSNYR